jgi:hypothetical protein
MVAICIARNQKIVLSFEAALHSASKSAGRRRASFLGAQLGRYRRRSKVSVVGAAATPAVLPAMGPRS